MAASETAVVEVAAGFTAALQAALGDAKVALAAAARATAAADVYRVGAVPAAVVFPENTEEVVAVVKLAAEFDAKIYVRGGGMSYTDAYLPETTKSVIVDLSRMTTIHVIQPTDLYATVDAGCTWAALDEAAAKHGLRATFWGPMSGKVSTVGGAMAQGAVTYGSCRNGPSVANVLGLEVVVANGTTVTTGSAGQPGHSPFFREYGPDLTGLFCADAGTLGIKTKITVPLEPRATHGTGLSFSFDSFEALLEAVRLVSREQLATEIFGADTALVKSVAGLPDLKNDLQQLKTMMQAADSPLAALRTAWTAAVNGRRFLDRSTHLMNFLTEGSSARDLKTAVQRLRDCVLPHGVEVANTVAEFTRAVPFPDPAVIGPQGRRLLPLHGVIPYSNAAGLDADYRSYLAGIRADCEASGVEVFIVYATSGRNGFLYECVIYWPDEWLDSHKAVLTEEQASMMTEPKANPTARALVEEIRQQTVEIFYRHGCAHFQIGRAYPFSRDRDAGALRVLRSLRHELDPDERINPGGLGL